MDNKHLASLLVLTTILASGCKPLDDFKSLIDSKDEPNTSISVSTYSHENEEPLDITTQDSSSDSSNNKGNGGKNAQPDAAEVIIETRPELVTIDKYSSLKTIDHIPPSGNIELISGFNNLVTHTMFKSSSNNENLVISAFPLLPQLGFLMEGINLTSHSEITDKIINEDLLDWKDSLASLLQKDTYNFDSNMNGQVGYYFKTTFLDTLFNDYSVSFDETYYITDPDFYLDEFKPKTDTTETTSLSGSSDIKAIWIGQEVAIGSNSAIGSNTSVSDEFRKRIQFDSENHILKELNGGLTINEVEKLFEDIDGQLVRTQMLEASGTLDQLLTEQYSVIELPTQSSEVSLLRIEPKAGQFSLIKSNLEEIIARFNNESESVETSVVIPPFSATHKLTSSDISTLLDLDLLQEKESADFSNINGKGFLYLEDISSESSIELGKAGIQFIGKSTSSLYATKDEPPEAFDFGYLSYDRLSSAFFSAFTFSISNYCDGELIENLADVFPFIYVLIDKNTNTIVSIGQITDVDGTPIEKWSCIASGTFEVSLPEPEEIIFTTPDLIHPPIPFDPTTTTP